MIGPRNLREKKSNQDAVMHRFWNKNWCIAVCDGMGSKPLSHIGSTLACQSVCNVLKHCDFSLAEKVSCIPETIFSRIGFPKNFIFSAGKPSTFG